MCLCSKKSVTHDADGNVVSEILRKTLDVNKYATKKTIAQGLLDVALLTANASQLKYVLQVGEKHEFYTLMLTLITISIILQEFTAFHECAAKNTLQRPDEKYELCCSKNTRALRPRQINSSAVAAHNHETGHNILFDKTKTLVYRNL
ncbi:uncharacterized protein LOC132703596 isoform X5 [Cylas formicarius]|uniref:uncharacterized protein LOC132703596 isoform X5 n=1 Tax=Cylas formicarius TaxID=197179 RepID=UPI0029585EF9|nr:uncharacterized protein LOC132703596 isoform X5 [Cylas formicarius]